MKRFQLNIVVALVALGFAGVIGVIVGARQSPEPLTGNWVVRTDNKDGTFRTTYLNLKQEGEKITGSYKGQLGEAPVTGTIKGNDITLSLKVSPQGEEITVTYTGKVTAKDAMSGKAVFGSLGEGAWTAKRK